MKEINGYAISDIPGLIRSGDRDAFAAVYNHYWDKLYTVARSRLIDEFQAEEVVQTVFFRLWSKRDGIEIHDLSAYLSAMTRYAVYEHLARESRLRERAQTWSVYSADQPSAISEIENRFLLKFIRELSNELPEKCRLVFVYNKLEDQSLADVASRMNISRKTAEAHLTKALRFIRLKMGNMLVLLLIILLFL